MCAVYIPQIGVSVHFLYTAFEEEFSIYNKAFLESVICLFPRQGAPQLTVTHLLIWTMLANKDLQNLNCKLLYLCCTVWAVKQMSKWGHFFKFIFTYQ